MSDLLQPERIYSISEITGEIKSVLESEFVGIWVEGEISNYKQHSSGHHYFTLKDKDAQLKAVIWRFTARSLRFALEDGMQVRAFGDITLYERGGYYQLRVNRIEPLGVGDLQKRFEQLKAKLAEEGLFDEARKKAIPAFPRSIGIVTSPTGAAVRDIINICRRRAPAARLIIRPAAVQGAAAAADIATAIEEFNRLGEVDVLIVGRGGGSLEDLWAFNEEVVARAIAGSKIPVVSAVGHEVDFTIADFVADLRAPTPSAAAELVTYDAAAILSFCRDAARRQTAALRRIAGELRRRWERAASARVLQRPEVLLEPAYQRLADVQTRLSQAAQSYQRERATRLDLATAKLAALAPENVLRRGYAIVREREAGGIVMDGDALSRGQRVSIRFAKGERDAEIE
ncbi:MAG: exodeoxyribonuclease VII large subunit [bacterium]